MPVARSKLWVRAVWVTFLLTSSAANAEIKFCNDFPHQVFVAIAYPQDGGSWLSRGWLTVDSSGCSVFDTALRVKLFYYRAESVDYRQGGHTIKTNWGSGMKFAIFERSNFNYWDAQNKVLNSSLADFSRGAETDGEAVSATVTFNADGKGSTVTIPGSQ